MSSPLYTAWVEMRRRCRAIRHQKNYSGRGISVCADWEDFFTFAADMGPHPGRGWTLDRKDNDLDYCPDNCRWATTTTQNRNKRTNKLSLGAVAQIRLLEGRLSQHKLAKLVGVSQSVVSEIFSMKLWK